MAREITTSTDRIETTNANASVAGLGQPFSILGWFRSPDNAAGSDYANVYEESDNIGTSTINVQMKQSGDVHFFYRPLGFGNPTVWIQPGGTWDDGLWHWFFFVSRATNDFQAYIDGSSVGTDTTSITATITPSVTTCGSGGNSLPVGARLARFKNWKSALTIGQAAIEAKSSRPQIRPNLYWELVGETPEIDRSGNAFHGAVTGAKPAPHAPVAFFQDVPAWRWVLNAGATLFTLSVGGAIAPAGAIARASAKIFGGAVSPSGAIAKAASIVKSGSISPSGITTRAVAVLKAGSVAMAGTLGRLVSKLSGGAISPQGLAAKAASRSLGGSISPNGAVQTLKVFLIALVGSISPVGAIKRSAAKSLAGSVAAQGAIARLISKLSIGSVSLSGAIQTTNLFIKNLGGAIAPTGSIRRDVFKSIVGALTPIGGGKRSIAKILSGLITLAGNAITQILDVFKKVEVTVSVLAVTSLTVSTASVTSAAVSTAAVTNVTLETYTL